MFAWLARPHCVITVLAEVLLKHSAVTITRLRMPPESLAQQSATTAKLGPSLLGFTVGLLLSAPRHLFIGLRQ